MNLDLEFLSPEQRLKKIDESISSIKKQIKSCDDAYESLGRFAKEVTSSKGDFNTVNSKRGAVLDNLSGAAKNNTVVKKYKSGMGSSLSGVGMSVVGLAFDGLKTMVSLKRTEYKSKKGVLKTELHALELERAKVKAEANVVDSLKRLGG